MPWCAPPGSLWRGALHGHEMLARPMNRTHLLSLVVILGACAAPASTPAPAPAPASDSDSKVAPAPDPAAAPEAGESRVLQGVLRYTEPPQSKSVEAFLNQSLVLVEGEASWNLAASAAVPEEQLRELDGKRIEVTATYVPPRDPDPRESAPMDGDKPMQRPAKWEVSAVKVLE